MPTVHARTIARAAQIVGGSAALCARLRVSPEGMTLWLSGKVEPPSRVFLDAVDIILEYQLTHLESHIKPSPVGDDIQ